MDPGDLFGQREAFAPGDEKGAGFHPMAKLSGVVTMAVFEAVPCAVKTYVPR